MGNYTKYMYRYPVFKLQLRSSYQFTCSEENEFNLKKKFILITEDIPEDEMLKQAIAMSMEGQG